MDTYIFSFTFYCSIYTIIYNSTKNVISSTKQEDVISGRNGTLSEAIVANIGNSRNWCGSDMAQANWYAFGRLAWNPELSSEQIAREFLMQTFSTNPAFVTDMTQVLCQSREACVKYMMPLGLHHIFAGNHPYGPEPWYAPKGVREDWLPPYYHKADANGLGFDRTVETGSGATKQYPPSLFKLYNDINRCPELVAALKQTRWNRNRNSYTARQVRLIAEYLCID